MSAYLITGGLGLIGSTVARHLRAAGSEVRILDNCLAGGGAHPANLADVAGLTIQQGDVRDEALLASLVTGCVGIIHCAAHTSHAGSMADPRHDLGHNVDGTAAVLDVVRRHAPTASVVFASTRQVYGRPSSLPVDERHPLAPPDVNGIGKRAAEELCALYGRIHGLRIAVLRLTNVYGPCMRIRDSRQMFLGAWMRAALENRDVVIYGDGSQRRDLLHVDDAATAMIAALGPAAANQVFNIGRPESVSLAELAALVVDVAGSGRIIHVPFPAERKAIDIGDYASDISAATAVLGWCPVVPLCDGVASTLAYYRDRLQDYVERAA